jgi:hypothetical protein
VPSRRKEPSRQTASSCGTGAGPALRPRTCHQPPPRTPRQNVREPGRGTVHPRVAISTRLAAALSILPSRVRAWQRPRADLPRPGQAATQSHAVTTPAATGQAGPTTTVPLIASAKPAEASEMGYARHTDDHRRPSPELAAMHCSMPASRHESQARRVGDMYQIQELTIYCGLYKFICCIVSSAYAEAVAVRMGVAPGWESARLREPGRWWAAPGRGQRRGAGRT